MPENPFNDGLGDLGMISEVSGDVLGSPDKVLKLMEQLARMREKLSQAPPTQGIIDKTILSGIKGALGAQDTFTDPLTGEETQAPHAGGSFGPAFLAGVQSSIEGRQAEALQKYEVEQRAAQRALEYHEKISAGVRAVMGQNPLAFEALGQTEEGKRAIGMLGWGIDIPIDPTAKSRQADETLQRKQLVSYYATALRSVTDPGARAEIVNRLQDLVDPDNKLGVSAADMAKGIMPSFGTIVEKYGDAGVSALNQYNQTGDAAALLTKLGALPIKESASAGKQTTLDVRTRLASKIAEVMRASREMHGKELTNEEAIKQLDDEDRVLAQHYLKETGASSKNPLSSYIAMLNSAHDDLPAELKEDDPAEAARLAALLADQRMKAAAAMKKRVDRRASQAAAAPAKAPTAAPMSITAWSAAVRAKAKKDFAGLEPAAAIAEANKALAAEYISKNKRDQVPATVLKKVQL